MLDLVDLVYAWAAGHADAALALRSLNECLGSKAAQMFRLNPTSGAVLESSVSEPFHGQTHSDYMTHWRYRDPKNPLLLSRRSGSVLRCHEALDSQFVARDPYYQEFFIPYGLRWAMGGLFRSSDGSMTVIATHREPDRPPFEPWTEALLRRLLRHFRRAAALREQFAGLPFQSARAEVLPEGARTLSLLVGNDGTVEAASSAVDSVLAELGARCRNGRIQFVVPAAQQVWSQAVAAAARDRLARSLEFSGPRGLAWTVRLVPLSSLAQMPDGRDRRLLFVTIDCCRTRSSGQRLPRGSERLTPAELAVLQLVVEGLPLKLISRVRGVSVNTVRTQISGILEKTGSRTRLELVAKVLPDAPGASS